MAENVSDTDPLATFLTSRRAALKGGALGISAALVGGFRTSAAQEATPAALPFAMSEWVAGWQSLDAGRIAAIYAEDAVHEIVATGEVLRGRDVIREGITEVMTAIPDASLELNGAFATEDAGVIDWTFKGHYSGQLPGFPPPGDQAVAFRAAIIFELAGDEVARSTEFYDLFGLLVQLGVLPAPGGEATPET